MYYKFGYESTIVVELSLLPLATLAQVEMSQVPVVVANKCFALRTIAKFTHVGFTEPTRPDWVVIPSASSTRPMTLRFLINATVSIAS